MLETSALDESALSPGSVDSRISGFYRLSLRARHAEIAARTGLSEGELEVLCGGGLDAHGANQLVENAIGIYALPLGLGLNFRINGRDYLVPMAVEEPSVIAAASNAARMVRDGGGFVAEAAASITTAQIELRRVPDLDAACENIQREESSLLAAADAAMPGLVERGGGARGLEVRRLQDELEGGARRLVVHIHVDCRDAMGANIVNTVAECLGARVAALSGGELGLRILSNLADRRLVRAMARVRFGSLALPGFGGEEVARGIAEASRFAELDPYRATTHNKGVMNGVDAVVIATGNDWRAVEAGAHAFAAMTGRYRPLATWSVEDGVLVGRIELPLAVGVVGGTLKKHAVARLAQRLLGVDSARELAMAAASVGLASNLAALRALATEGIQRGHMGLHRRAMSGERPALSVEGEAR